MNLNEIYKSHAARELNDVICNSVKLQTHFAFILLFLAKQTAIDTPASQMTLRTLTNNE